MIETGSKGWQEYKSRYWGMMRRQWETMRIFFIFSSNKETTRILGNLRETLGDDKSIGQCMSRKHYARLSSIKKPSMECWFFIFSSNKGHWEIIKGQRGHFDKMLDIFKKKLNNFRRSSTMLGDIQKTFVGWYKKTSGNIRKMLDNMRKTLWDDKKSKFKSKIYFLIETFLN
jgi:hypothetical protein